MKIKINNNLLIIFINFCSGFEIRGIQTLLFFTPISRFEHTGKGLHTVGSIKLWKMKQILEQSYVYLMLIALKEIVFLVA